MGMTIGSAAERSNCTPPTIRYYEEIGLLRPIARGSNGRRSYGWPDVSRLTFIRRCRDLGFPVDQVRALLKVMDAEDPSCLDARDLVQAHLETVRAKRVQIEALEQTLLGLSSTCTDACASNPTPDCRILEDLTGATPGAAQR